MLKTTEAVAPLFGLTQISGLDASHHDFLSKSCSTAPPYCAVNFSTHLIIASDLDLTRRLQIYLLDLLRQLHVLIIGHS
jgi:hypothetical protein